MIFNGNIKFHTLGSGELQNAVIERLASDPTGVAGRIYYNTTDNVYKFHNGTSWSVIQSSGDVTALQTEVNSLETSLGSMVNGSGVFQASAFAGFGNTTTPTDLLDALTDLDAAITDALEFTDVGLNDLNDVTITASAAGQVLYTTGANTWVNGNIGATSGVQAYDAGLTSIAGLTTAADKMIYTTASDTYAVTDLSAFGRSLIDDADASTARTTLGVVIGTDVQQQDAFLTSIATLGTAADKMIYTTAADTAAETDLGSYARTNIINQTSEANFKASVNLEIGVDVQAYDAGLLDIAGLAVTDGNIIVGNGTNWVVESGATARASLGLAIGTDIQAYDAGLAALAAAGTGMVSMSGDTAAFRTITGTASNITVSDGDGVAGNPTIDLATVTNPGNGGSFVKVTTDSYGRVTNSTAVVTGDITTLVDSTYVNVSGDTMSSNADLVFVGGGEVIGLPATPSVATAAASKAYVDALVVSGTVWKSPVNDPDIQDAVGSDPSASIFSGMSVGDTYTYIATAAFTFAGQGGGTSYAASIGDVVTLEKTSVTVGNWSFIDSLTAGDRFIIAAEHGTVGSTLFGVGFRKNDVIEYISGAANLYASWSKPEDAQYQVINFTSAKVTGSATGLTNDATSYDLNVKIGATTHNVAVTGSAVQTFGTLASVLQTNLQALGGTASAATVVLETEGHFHIYSNTTDQVVISEGTGANPLLAGLGSNFDSANIRSNLLAGIVDGATILVNDADSKHYAHTYVYTHGINAWTEIAGPGAVGAGVGLVYSGTVLNINLGAGIIELPSDEVGLDVESGKAVQLTSALTGGQLTFVLDGSTMSQSASGLKIAAGGVTGTELNASVAGAGLAGGGGSALSVNVDDSSIEINVDTLRVKALGITNAMLAGSIAAGKLTLADGKFIVGNGSNVGAEVTPTGDVTFNNAGVFAITAGSIVNADVNASAAIDFSKLATLASGNILVGSAGGVATSVAMTGDVTIDNLGATTIGASKVTNAMLVNSSVTIAGDSGSDAVALGETLTFDGNATQGVSTSMATNTLSITVADATTSTKGVASFDTSHFSVTSGAVSLAASLSDLSDVNDSISPVDGSFLVHDGTDFKVQKIYFTEAKTSSATWTVTHNLGVKFCNVTVVDSADEVIIPESIKFDSTTQLTVTFNTAIAGQVVVMGVA